MSYLGFIMVTTVFVLIVEFVEILKSNHDEAEGVNSDGADRDGTR